jgi:hypothetical protein
MFMHAIVVIIYGIIECELNIYGILHMLLHSTIER